MLSVVFAVVLFSSSVLGENTECARVRKRTAEYWEQKWDFAPLPFGGQFIDVYLHNTTTTDLPPTYPMGVKREYGVHAYCLVKEGDPSQFRYHYSDNVWHWYFGNTIRVYVIEAQTGIMKTYNMGMSTGNFVISIKAGDCMAAKIAQSKRGRYALMGVTNIPSIISTDIVVPTRMELINKFPQHEAIITELTSDIPVGLPEP